MASGSARSGQQDAPYQASRPLQLWHTAPAADATAERAAERLSCRHHQTYEQHQVLQEEQQCEPQQQVQLRALPADFSQAWALLQRLGSS
jgi:hypothetical protein